jgi:hypothetical protein
VITVEWNNSLSRTLAVLFGKFLAGGATFSIGHEGP